MKRKGLVVVAAEPPRPQLPLGASREDHRPFHPRILLPQNVRRGRASELACKLVRLRNQNEPADSDRFRSRYAELVVDLACRLLRRDNRM